MRKWFNAQEQKWHCKDFPFSLFSSLANHLEDEFSLTSAEQIFHSQFLVSFCSLQKFCFCLSRCESKNWKFLVKIFRFFVIYVLLLLLLVSCITTILWASTILVDRAKKCWVNFFIFNFFNISSSRGGVGEKKKRKQNNKKKLKLTSTAPMWNSLIILSQIESSVKRKIRWKRKFYKRKNREEFFYFF